MRAIIIATIFLVAPVVVVTPACSQEWPSRPIRLLTPLAAGGAADVLGRVVGDELFSVLKQPIVIENRPGAGGTLAATTVMRAQPDGYTLLLGTAGALSISPILSRNAPYDPVKDFTPLALAVELPICLVVHKGLPVNNVSEFVAYAKSHPGKLSFGSSGPNTTHHLAGEYLKAKAGIDMLHVPYRGGNPAMNDLLTGQIPVLFATLSTAIPHIESGNIKVLGLVEGKRSASHPNIPTIGESVPGYAVPSSFIGFLAPAELPAPLKHRISATLIKALGTPSVRKSLEASGFDVTPGTPDAFEEVLRASVERFRQIVTDAGIQPQ